MSVNSKMTALADEIRELSGTTTPKSIDAMTTDVDVANAEIAEQAELLEQIATALEGKASGSGGNVENCAVTLEGFERYLSSGFILHTLIDSSGEIQTIIDSIDFEASYPALKGSSIALYNSDHEFMALARLNAISVSGGIIQGWDENNGILFIKITDNAVITAE